MPNGRLFVIMYSLVLIVLFILFSYLMTTIDPHTKPHNITNITTEPAIKRELLTLAFSETTSTTNITSNTEDDKKKKIERGPTHLQASTKEINYPFKVRGHRRKEDIIDGITQTVRPHNVTTDFSQKQTFLYRIYRSGRH